MDKPTQGTRTRKTMAWGCVLGVGKPCHTLKVVGTIEDQGHVLAKAQQPESWQIQKSVAYLTRQQPRDNTCVERCGGHPGTVAGSGATNHRCGGSATTSGKYGDKRSSRDSLELKPRESRSVVWLSRQKRQRISPGSWPPRQKRQHPEVR